MPFLYEAETPMTGRSVIDDVASLILRVFNQDSEQDKMLFDAAVPILAAFGVTEQDADVLVKATSNLWRFSDPSAKLAFTETSGASFEARRQQINDNIDSIREISLRQIKSPSAQVESAEAKRLDSIQIRSQLAEYARSAAGSERQCWRLAAKWAGESDTEVEKIEIQYNEEFDPASLEEQLTDRFMELRKNGDVSRTTLWKRLGMTDDQIAEENALLEQEARLGQGATGEGMGDTVAAILGRARQIPQGAQS